MADPATGLILAGLDVDVDNGEAWNRWYDLEHLAPNVSLPGIVTGRRYVAPPSLHASRQTAVDDPAWGSGRGVYLTWYATSVDPGEAIATMTTRRDELEAEGRMAGAGARTVRTGDALDLVAASSSPELLLAHDELLHVGHRGLRLILEEAERAPTCPEPVVASLRFASRFTPGLFVELQLLDRPAAHAVDPLCEADPRPDARLVAGFEPIVALDYPFLDEILASELPRTIEG